ncbi:MAG: 23S rRNA (pseudouridine(1915)-N(3))-methyltransferase RlmH [Pseudomonadota bacterium]
MQILIAAVGRLRGPEQTLCAEYCARATQAGRRLSLGPVEIREVDERRAVDRDAQATRLLDLTEGCHRIALDERGKALDSSALAARMERLRDDGTRRLAFMIGGADGHGGAALLAADLALSLGPMVWPHALARVMLAEQVYRVTQIVSGTPYHRA